MKVVKGCQLPSITASKLKVKEQAPKQGQDEECQALPWLSVEGDGVQEKAQSDTWTEQSDT